MFLSLNPSFNSISDLKLGAKRREEKRREGLLGARRHFG
jgi:hypothetical protein